MRTSGAFRAIRVASPLAAIPLLLLPLLSGCASAPATAPAAAHAPAHAADSHATGTVALTAEQALARLRAGNERFVAGRPQTRALRAEVAATSRGQSPFAAVIGCMDSRVPPETVFDQGLGDLFVLRVAGNVASPDILGSLEYATEVVATRFILVLGHSSCGAVKGACDGVELGNLTGLLQRIEPAVAASASVPGEHSSKNHDYVDAVTVANVRQTMRDLVAQSPLIAARVERGEVAIRGAVYELSTGRVTFLDAH